MLRATLAVALAAVSVLAGCEVVTGGTNGYSAPDAASTGCTTSKDCADAQTCCYALVDGGLPTTQCQASCAAWEQPCQKASDCGDGGEGGECLVQSCPVSVSGLTTTVSVSTCGVISFCSQ